MSYTPWPVKLEVTHKGNFISRNLGEPKVYWYTAIVEMAIRPYVVVDVYDFCLKLFIRGEWVRADLGVRLEPSSPRIARGYILRPEVPLGLTKMYFEFMVKEQEIAAFSIDGLVVLEAGLRKGRFAIRKAILLNRLR